VGEDEQTITAHRDILLTSKFFNAALSKGFLEAENGIVRLPDDDSIPVGAYIHWLYTRTPFNNIDYALRCYAFGHKVCDEDFCNKVIDAIIHSDKIGNLATHFSYLGDVYRHGLRGSKLAIYSVKSLCHYFAADPTAFSKTMGLESIQAAEGHEILQDVVPELIRAMQNPGAPCPSDTDPCLFHDHVNTPPCPAKRTEK
jgi:hypothetical protein